MAVDFKQRLRSGLPELVVVAQRFPLAILAASALTLYFLLGLQKSAAWPEDVRQNRIPFAMTAGFLWAFAATLHGEARGLEKRVRHALVLVGWLVAGLLAALTHAVELNPVLFLGALILALSVAAFAMPQQSNPAFWQFNHNLWFGWIASSVALLLSVGGIMVILESLRYLFGLAIPSELYEKFWVIAGLLAAPTCWLAQVPRSFDTAVAEGEPTELVSRLIAALVKFILAPLLLVYVVILHVYAVKILVDGELPKGRLGWMVLTFGGVLAATALVTYPTRASGGRLVAVFWRIWPWTLVVPLGLLFLAVGARIREYGLTEQRYVVALAGMWLASLVVTQGLAAELMGKGRDLRLIPAVLMGLMFVASLGPWGVTGWPIRNQLREFSARLEAAGMLKDGRVPADARPATTLLASDKQRLHGIIDYLSLKGRLDALRPLFLGQANDPFQGRTSDAATRIDFVLAKNIRERLALGSNVPETTRRFRNYHSSKPAAFPIGASGQHSVAGPFSIYKSATYRPGPLVAVRSGSSLTVALEQNVLTVRDSGGQTATFDLAKLAVSGGLISIENAQAPNGEPVSLPRTSGDLPIDLLLVGINGVFDTADAVEINNIQFWLLLGP